MRYIRKNKNLMLDDVDIPRFMRNFSGLEGRYNREGDRNFCLLLSPEEMQLIDPNYWLVKYLKPRDEEDEPRPYLQVAVKWPRPGGKADPPKVVMITSKGKTVLDEDMVGILDWASIERCDVIIRPYEWTVNDKSGVKAYLKSIYVTIEEDELEKRYADVPDSAMSGLIGTTVEEDAPPWSTGEER